MLLTLLTPLRIGSTRRSACEPCLTRSMWPLRAHALVTLPTQVAMSQHISRQDRNTAGGTTKYSRRMSHRPPTYLSCASLARELDVCERNVQELVRRGVLPPPVKLSPGCVRWNWFVVQTTLDSLGTFGSPVEDPFMKGVRNVTSAR